MVSVHTKRDLREEQPDRQSNLFIKNIPKTFTDKDLTELFESFGPI
jgi:RNA recognition motif-containing protein